MATTYNNLYLDARRRLRAAGAAAAELEARELLCFASDKDRSQLYRDLTLYAADSVAARLEALLERRLAGEPVAYLIGEWEFYGLPLDISPEVLIPRADTEVLAARAIELAEAAGEGARVLDLCAGSGCVGLAVAAKAPGCRAVLADLSEGALRLCRQNVRRNGLSARVSCLPADARSRPPAVLGDFDVIVCNPPYIPSGEIAGLDVSVRDYEPHMALDGGADGLNFYREICSLWLDALRRPGTLLFEVGAGQAPQVELIMARAGLEQILTHRDTGDIWRVVEGRLDQRRQDA